MNRNDYLQSIKDKDSSVTIGKIMKLKDAPYNKSLVLVEDSLNIHSINDIGAIDILNIMYGSVFVKAGTGLVKLLNDTTEVYGLQIKYRLIPSHLNLENNRTFDRANNILRANKRIDSDARVSVLNEMYIGDTTLIKPKQHIQSSGSLTLADLLMSDVEIVRSNARDDIRYRFSLNRDLTVKVTPYNYRTKVGIGLNIAVNWSQKPIQDAKPIMKNYEDICYRPYIKNTGLEYRLDDFLRTHISYDREDFINILYEMAESDLFDTGILNPRHLASYLLEYLGLRAMALLVNEYNDGGITLKTFDKCCKMLPKKLVSYPQVLQDLHRLPFGTTKEDFKSNIFKR